MQFITPDWSAPPNVQAASTQRLGGQSNGGWESFNLGDHVADLPENVSANRILLGESLKLPSEPEWLQQVHGTEVLHVKGRAGEVPTADAVWTDQNNTVLSIMTADCLPVLIASKSGECIAAAHAGWRGLASGIVQKTVAALPVASGDLVAWMGPAIGPKHFEVGEEVKQAFISVDPASEAAFVASATDEKKYLADLFMLAAAALSQAGVVEVYGGGVCTYSDAERFFSYRRDGGATGRMASLIWMTA